MLFWFETKSQDQHILVRDEDEKLLKPHKLQAIPINKSFYRCPKNF